MTDEVDLVPWPTPLCGVTECVVATEGPDGRYNLAALGVHTPEESASGDESRADDELTAEDESGAEHESTAEDERGAEDEVTAEGDGRTAEGLSGRHGDDTSEKGVQAPATARTWGRTRTARNLRETGRARVVFTGDPLVFVRAALAVRERDELPRAEEWVGAWADVRVAPVDAGEDGGTEWVDWELRPVDAAVEHRAVPALDRAVGAVLEASVAASRLDVPGYDAAVLRARIDHAADVVERCGGSRERAAMAVVEDALAAIDEDASRDSGEDG